jgi:hypothetical protein
MPTISNDTQFRQALEQLQLQEQRAVAALFVNRLAQLAREPQLREAIDTAMDPDASATQRANAYRNAKSIAVSSYTTCGKDADWLGQAEHFLAAACAVALTPDDAIPERLNLAWKAAMQTRMAHNCAMIDSEQADDVTVFKQQYDILEEFLS